MLALGSKNRYDLKVADEGDTNNCFWITSEVAIMIFEN